MNSMSIKYNSPRYLHSTQFRLLNSFGAHSNFSTTCTQCFNALTSIRSLSLLSCSPLNAAARNLSRISNFETAVHV